MTEIDPDKLWTAKQCADYLGIEPNTWHSYVKRPAHKHPAPRPVRKYGTTPLWDPDAVRDYGDATDRRASNRADSPASRREQALTLLAAGKSVDDIAHEFHVTRRTVFRWKSEAAAS